jgi:pyruvate dehydrogenase E2 component (dihydrolipoamide acetyltransferase)
MAMPVLDDPASPGATNRQVPEARVAKLGPMQRIAAAHLSKSQLETAPITLLGEVEVDALVTLRAALNADAVRGAGPHVSLTALLVKIVAQALSAHPALNCTFVDGEVRVFDAVHMGVALSMPDDNLVVPVVRDVGRRTLAEVADALADVGARAKAGRLTLEDVRGATFTLTNPGSVPSAQWATPIIPLPQCAILGVGALKLKPVVRGGEVVSGWVLPTSLTVDHRVVNGVPAQRFVDTLYGLLAAPETANLAIWNREGTR